MAKAFTIKPRAYRNDDSSISVVIDISGTESKNTFQNDRHFEVLLRDWVCTLLRPRFAENARTLMLAMASKVTGMIIDQLKEGGYIELP